MRISPKFEKVVAACKFIGIKKNLDIQNSYTLRFLTQKIAYLAKALGMQIDYEFSIYLKGPYSPTLTNDYYAFSNKITLMKTRYKLTNKDEESLRKINDFIINKMKCDDPKRRAEFIEATSTVVYLINENKMTDDREIFKFVKTIKPYLTDSEIVIATNRAKCLLFKPEYLTEEIRRETEEWESID